MSNTKEKRRRTLLPEAVQNMPVGSDLAQDQVIISPAIMVIILKTLDFRSLKQVRLVCKGWLREAQAHMERRGIIHFDRDTSTGRIREFEDLRKNKILIGLPQPFHCVDVDIGRNHLARVVQLFSRLRSGSPPLVLTKFSTESFDVDQAVRLIIEHSPSLEYLKLTRETFNDAHTLKKGQMFPKLRHLVVKGSKKVNEDDIYTLVDFPSFVAKIVKGSPNLETLESHNKPEPTGRELLRTVDIRNIKTLNLDYVKPKQSTVDYLLTVPFCQLQNLKLVQCNDDAKLTEGIIKTCSTTLKVLDLSSAPDQDDIPEFPVCPNVQELQMHRLECLHKLPQYYPSLQVLQVIYIDLNVEDKLWREQSPFPGLKTLRVSNADLLAHSGEFYFKFFEKLPGLECLSLNAAAVLRYCRLQASGKTRFSKILKGLKHLEIRGPYAIDVDDDEADDTDYSSLATLKGVEMITLLESNEALLRIPVRNMPRLKVIRFPWGAHHHSMGRLLALARRMEKIAITNCCSFPRLGKNPWSNDILNSFFDSAPNVVCGCKGMEN